MINFQKRPKFLLNMKKNDDNCNLLPHGLLRYKNNKFGKAVHNFEEGS